MSEFAYRLAGVSTVLSGRKAERAQLPFGRRACKAERARLSGCAHLWAGARAALSGRAIWHVRAAGELTIWQACSHSAGQAHLSGCAYHLAGVRTVLRGCA